MFTVKANGVTIDSNPFDDGLGYATNITKTTCGENRFVALANFLEFYISPGCEIKIKPRDAIQGLVRMDWTLEEFWASGGTSMFIHRMASILGIHPSRVYVLQVYLGSVINEFIITPELEEDDDP